LVLLYQEGSSRAKQGLVALIKERVLYCIHHHRSLNVASSMQQELGLLTELVTGASNADAQAWQSQMLLLFQLLLPATGNSQEWLAMLHHRCIC
jgi:E3 ubiquitin-protein ligase UBR4